MSDTPNIIPDTVQKSEKSAANIYKAPLTSEEVSYTYMDLVEDPETGKSYRKERKIRVARPNVIIGCSCEPHDMIDFAMATRFRNIPAIPIVVPAIIIVPAIAADRSYAVADKTVERPYNRHAAEMAARFRNIPAIPIVIPTTSVKNFNELGLHFSICELGNPKSSISVTTDNIEMSMIPGTIQQFDRMSVKDSNELEDITDHSPEMEQVD